jgi:BASS family bile acid:Na+ symporter
MHVFVLGLEFLARYATRALALGVLIGLALPPLAELFRPTLAPVIFINMILVLLRLDFSAVFRVFRQPFRLLAVIALLLVASPMAMALALGPIGLPAGLVLGLVLMAAAPPINSAPAFALILGLDAAFAVAVVISAHILVPFTLPLTAQWLLDLDLQISPLELMARLAGFIGGALAVTFVLKRWVLSAAFLQANAKRIDGAAVFGLVVFAIGIMAGVTDVAIARPGYVITVLVAAFIANAGLQALGAGIAWRLGRQRAFTVGHMAGNCNMGLILAVLADRAPLDTVVFFALAQVPMYMLPTIAVPLYRRLLKQS